MLFGNAVGVISPSLFFFASLFFVMTMKLRLTSGLLVILSHFELSEASLVSFLLLREVGLSFLSGWSDARLTSQLLMASEETLFFVRVRSISPLSERLDEA